MERKLGKKTNKQTNKQTKKKEKILSSTEGNITHDLPYTSQMLYLFTTRLSF